MPSEQLYFYVFFLVPVVRSNTWGTEFVTYDKGINPSKIQYADPTRIRKELCAVTYVSRAGTGHMYAYRMGLSSSYVNVDTSNLAK